MNTRTHMLIILPLLFLLLPATVSAATISFRAVPTAVGVGDVVRVSILLDSFVPTNTFSAAVSYSRATLEPIAVSDGNSIINLWLTRPTVSLMTFAGIIPGGFSGTNGMLFSLLFRAKAAGTATVSLDDVVILRNDGAGGEEPTLLKPLAFSVGPRPLGGYTEPADDTPPESFTAYLGNNPQLFDGRSYLVFTTVDKGSGIDHYEIAETRVPSFLLPFFPLSWDEAATSPSVIRDQNLTSAVYIKAIDRSSNERLSIFPPQHLFTAYEKIALLGILIVFVFLLQRRRGGRSEQNP